MSGPLPNGRHRGRDLDSGFAVASVAILAAVLILISAVVMMRVTASINSTGEDRRFEHSFFAAESGVDTALVELTIDPDYHTVSEGTDLSTREHVVAAAEALAASPANIVETPEGEFVIVKPEGSDVVYAVGATPGWQSGRRQIRVVEVTYAVTSVAATCWPEAAIIAGGLVETGDAQITSLPSSQHTAAIIGNFDMKGNSSLWVDGDVRVAGSVSSTPPEAVFGVIESGATPLEFPTNSELSAWESSLIAEAQAGGTISGIDLSGPMTITAPVYVDGDVELHSGARLTIEGPGTVYINGFMELAGDSEVYNGSLLAVRDNFKQGGGTSYVLTGEAADAGLMSFFEDNQAIEFQGSATGLQGVIYSARGGIKLSGSAALNGSAIAGAPAPDGQVKFGGGTTMTYPSGLISSSTWLPAVTGGPHPGACVEYLGEYYSIGSVIANGDVNMSGGAGTATIPSEEHLGHVTTNGNFAGSGFIDGNVSAVGSVSGGSAHGSMTSGSSKVAFPPESQIAAWEQELRAAAKLGGTIPSVSCGCPVTITTPKYIAGDLTVSGGNTLTVTGGGVLFVEGNITSSGGGSTFNDGIIAANGIIKISGTGGYQVNGSATDTLLVSFAVNSKALELSGGSAGLTNGIAYAARGGMVLSGGSSWRGALITGGNGSNGKLIMSGGSVAHYPAGMIENTSVLPESPDPPPVPVAGINITGAREY